MEQSTIDSVLKFRDDRDWLKYHNGKDLAISISLEANELLENYQWSAGDVDRVNKIDGIKEELADVMIYSIMLADYYGLDLDEIINEKLEKNLKKYPNGKKIDLSKK
ncbi:MAG: nucleotide pyrophosphohydrolase [Clostridia bacterium]|nr:nucleotide pyrophosphohydrolase [Clostridia bacterium]MDY5264281.1 nucleotide pyrophosphohydrolase [Eubacteriales bacterium]